MSMVQCVTNGIKVSVVANFEGAMLRNYKLHNLFSYEITIENLSDATVQLLSRKWLIMDASRETEVVEGEGVVGKQPILQPAEKYSYISNSYLTSPNGAMKGFYKMLNLETDTYFKVKIPTFQLTVPSIYN